MCFKGAVHICAFPLICALCGEDGEPSSHLFLHCKYVRQIWTHICGGLSVEWVMPKLIREFLLSWGKIGEIRGKKGKLFTDAVILGVMWGIWKERNKRIFENVKKEQFVLDSIVREVGSWLLISNEFHATSLNDFIWDWTIAISPSISTQQRIGTDWMPPPRGKMKLNFDGSAIGNPGPSRFRGIIRNENGQVVLVMCGPLGEGDSTKVELLSLLYSLREVEKVGQQGCLVEGDSKVVISWALGLCEGVWKWKHFIQEIMSRMGIVLYHISRTQNKEADHLAKWGRDQAEMFKGNTFPDWD